MDPPALSPNTGTIVKRFVTVKALDIVFFPLPADPLDMSGIPNTEYVVTETVTNSTALPWTDYHMQLGSGSGSAFVLGTPFADFDVADGPHPFESSVFATAEVLSEDEIKFSGGTVMPGEGVTFTYAIDEGGGFTLRQFPTVPPRVPNPATLALVGAGAGLLGMRVWRRARAH